MDPVESEPLSGQDLSFWWADQPRQRTTMAMLLLLDRRPQPECLRAAALRAVAAVPRLRQRVVDAVFDLARPRWQDDPTFDPDFHIRRYAVASEDGDPRHATLEDLFRTLGPIYERPFDRTRPLWELIELEGPGEGAAVFFRLHHAVADGVGGNAILAALTDAAPEGAPLPVSGAESPGPWEETAFGARLRETLAHRRSEAAERRRSLARLAWRVLTDPRSLARGAAIARSLIEDATYKSQSPLKHFGRSRHLAGLELPFEPLRAAREALGGQMIDVLLTAVARAVGAWHDAHGMRQVSELMTLVPITLRPRAHQGLGAATGNRATGIAIRLPIRGADPVSLFREIHERVQERKEHPAVESLPALAEAVAVLPRSLYRTLAHLGSGGVNLIVTNVPGIMQTRYLAGAEIIAGYPFAPVAPHCPVSVALYGYRESLFVGLDADGTSMPDLAEFREMLRDSFATVIEAARKLAGDGRPAPRPEIRSAEHPTAAP
jgi:WS/DGAT/MGAT family acyltransferase